MMFIPAPIDMDLLAAASGFLDFVDFAAQFVLDLV